MLQAASTKMNQRTEKASSENLPIDKLFLD